jgi:hypothetical protein
MILTDELADEIYTVLQEECGECDLPDHRERDSFVRYMTSGERGLEYRFQGALGFGGKCRLNSNHSIPYVDYYPEDYTVERENMRDRANERIAALFAAEVPNVLVARSVTPRLPTNAQAGMQRNSLSIARWSFSAE